MSETIDTLSPSEDWEARYRSGETPWSKGSAAPGLVAELARQPRAGRALVPGCGVGHEIAALCAAGLEAVGIDIAPSAVAAARELLADVPGARVELVDLLDLPADFRGAFDLVVEHTCFCAIPRARRDDYVRAVAEALRPGGELLALFYLNPRDDPDPTVGPPFNASVEELAARFSPCFEIVDQRPPAAFFPAREGRETLWSLRRRQELP